MRVQLRGYWTERRKDGTTRHRVRVKGDKARKIDLPIGPDHPAFSTHYHAARRGEKLDPPADAAPMTKSLDAMCEAYLTVLERDVRHGLKSHHTLKQRKSLLTKACDMPDDTGTGRMGDLHCDLGAAGVRHIIAQWGAKTGQADNTVKALRAAYERMQWTDSNPCAGIKKVHKSRGGAVPWSIDDVRDFIAVHPRGTSAHVWLMLALFTGARLDDLHKLGRKMEVTRDGITWIEWQPGKAGSTRTCIPLAPQLVAAIRATGVIGKTYILNNQGQPYASSNALARAVERWTHAAGLERRSSHGLRKALGALLAEAGATQHQIMSVMSHVSPTTSAIYTRSAERTRLAGEAMAAIGGLRFD